MRREGFTLIEVLIVVAIISILATIVLVSTMQSKRNARLNNAKTTLKNVILVVYSCNDAGSPVVAPSGTETGTKMICANSTKSFWPTLQGGYTYVAGGNYTINCNFQVSTNGDSAANLQCLCATQRCN
jgi:prepilin-type N-terminal cleavage/methylation domain-containing protein